MVKNINQEQEERINMKKQTTMKVQLAVAGVIFGLSGMYLAPISAAAANNNVMSQEKDKTAGWTEGVIASQAENKVHEDKMVAQAEDETAAQTEATVGTLELGQLMTADENVDMKAEPSDSAETIMSYQAGDPVFVTGDAEGGWYRAVYQDKEGYIPQDSLSLQEIDVAGLDEEMARTQQEAELVVETVERYRTEARRSKIWGIVIVILVLGIFATGIISGIKSAKNKEEQDA